jgi:AcrR family transcriptional regulator
VTSAPEWTEGGLAVRPPQQQRSREGWARVLEAGVALLEEGGYEAFTIAAVCERAVVPPRALYARIDSKDALFLAVYEHGMERVRSEHSGLTAPAHLNDRPAVHAVVGALAQIFERHRAFLRAVVLVSSAHPEVADRGRRYAGQLADAFTSALPIADEAAERAAVTCFAAVFSALVVRTAYGPAFAGPDIDDATFVSQLADMVADHVLPAR